MSAPLADDGLPKINVIEFATAIALADPAHLSMYAATTIYEREVRAMAQAVRDFHLVLEMGVILVTDIADLSDKPKSLAQRAAITANLFKFAEGLHHTGYLEASDAKNLLG